MPSDQSDNGMKLRAAFQINGQTLMTQGWGYGDTLDGRYMLRFPPMGVEEAKGLAAALSHSASWVGINVWIDGLPSVAELATRLAAVEKAVADAAS